VVTGCADESLWTKLCEIQNSLFWTIPDWTSSFLRYPNGAPMEKSIYSMEYTLFLGVLRAVREEAGITQQEIAARLGATQSFVSKCERGERRLDIVELRAWCSAEHDHQS